MEEMEEALFSLQFELRSRQEGFAGDGDVLECVDVPGACLACGCRDFAVDSTSAVVCVSCSAVDHYVRVASGSGRSFDPRMEENLQTAFQAEDQTVHSNRKGNSLPYSRATYFNERISQWAMAEPRIPDRIWDKIDVGFLDYTAELGFAVNVPSARELAASGGRQLPNTYVLSKEEVATILARAESLDDFADIEDTPPKPKRRGRRRMCTLMKEVEAARRKRKDKKGWMKDKFLEKWLTIRWRYSGKTSRFHECPAWIAPTLQEQFQLLQPAFRACVYDSVKRRSFPNYSFGFRRLLELNGQDHALVDFPLLKTRRKRLKLDDYWWRMCKFMQWPYINCDQISKKRSNVQDGGRPAKRRKAGAAPQHPDPGIRRGAGQSRTSRRNPSVPAKQTLHSVLVHDDCVLPFARAGTVLDALSRANKCLLFIRDWNDVARGWDSSARSAL